VSGDEAKRAETITRARLRDLRKNRFASWGIR